MLKDRDISSYNFNSFKDFINSSLYKTISKNNREVVYSFYKQRCFNIIKIIMSINKHAGAGLLRASFGGRAAPLYASRSLRTEKARV
jgi:hypothetical protein